MTTIRQIVLCLVLLLISLWACFAGHYAAGLGGLIAYFAFASWLSIFWASPGLDL